MERDDETRAEFERLYRRHARPLWAYLARASGSPQAADDLAQECFMRYLRAAPRLADDDHRRNYLYRIGTNLLRNRFQRAPREEELMDDEAATVQHTAPGAGEDHQILRRDVAALLQRLTLRQRQMLWLAYVEGFTHREIGIQLGLGTDSVRQLLLRARRKLAALAREPEESS